MESLDNVALQSQRLAVGCKSLVMWSFAAVAKGILPILDTQAS
jgi:hypothetical protein